MTPDWMLSAACRGKPADRFFSDHPEAAKRVCVQCPVRLHCLNYAIENDCEGIWGGTTDEERDQMPKVPHPSFLALPPVNSLSDLIAQIAGHLHESHADLVGPSRRVPLVHHRQVAFAVCRRVTRASLPTIAQAFGRDHTTVMHGIQRVESDPLLSQLAEQITAQVAEESAAPPSFRQGVRSEVGS